MQNKPNKESIDNLKFVIGKAVHSGNNHLSTIITSCDLLMSQYTGEVQHRVNVIKARCKLMADQFKSLRDFSALGDSDLLIMNTVSVVCEKMFHEHVKTIKPSTPIQFLNKIPDDVKIHAGVVMTETLFGELLKNSIQSLSSFQSEKKIIIASAEQLSDRLVISISDSGPELEDEIKDYMFQPFYSSRKTDTGMGLSFVKQILIMLNGHIFFERKDGYNVFKIEFNSTTGSV